MSTIKVLSFDGGGERGLIQAQFMKLFVQLWGINPNELWKYFDVIAGTSIGGIQALCYAKGLSPDDVIPFFNEDGPNIFTIDPDNPSVMPSTLSKVNTILGGPFSTPTFYPSDVPGIGTMRLKDKLTEIFGTDTLQNLNTDVVITSFEKNDDNPDFSQFSNTPVYFSSVSNTLVPGLTGQTALAVDVAMATSAAPLYFAPYNFTLPGDTGLSSYLDGGVIDNNPSPLALATAKSLKPSANRFCLLSPATGLGDVGFPPALARKYKRELAEFRENPELFADKWRISKKELNTLKKLDAMAVLDGAYLIMYLLGVMTTGPQEVNAKEMDTLANYTLENLFNYRAQYYLDPELDTEMDNTTPEIRQYYIDSATEYFNNNIDAITNFIAHLDA